MINTLCGSIHDPSSNSEYPTSSSKSPPNESSNSETKNILPSSQEETLEPKNTLTPPSLDFPPIKFELDEVPPDSLMWDTFFTDHFLDSSDFMISSPIRNNYMMSSSPPATTNITTTTVTTNSSLISYNNNINNIDNYSYNNSYQIQAMQCSPPRFSPSNHVGGFNSSSSNYLKPKGQSPLRRMFNSPNNNNNNNNFQYMQLSDCNSLASLQAALGDHGFISSSPIKFPGTTENMSKQLLGDVSATNNNPAVLDCLQMENSSGFSGSSSDQGSSSSSTSLSQQLQKERHQEKQQQHNKFAHALMPPGPINTDQEQDSGLQLVHLLLACAEAVSKEEYMLARRYLYQLNRIVSPLGDSMQRVAACFTEALTARLAATLTTKPTTPSSSSSSTLKPLISPNIPPNPFEILKIYQIVYQACPYIKFAHFTANQAIFEAFEAEERVHIIDLDILQGYQWPAFMQALAARPNGAPFLRITGVGPCIEYIKETGRSLTQLAHSLHIPFEFHPVDEQLEDLRPHMLNRRVGEALAVNAVNRLHRVSGNSLGNLLTMIRDQAPNIVTLVEQEASHNGPYFLGRFLEALHYYSAIFDSLDATFPQDSAQRAKVEQYIFAPEIRNIVACEGVERIERHERLEKWRKIMEGKGYEGVPLSANAVTQSKILLGLYSCDGYRLTEEKGCLLLGWQDRAILAASSWR